MGKIFQLALESDDLGQLLEGLHARAEAWQKTAQYLESGYSTDESFVCEECSDPQEAKAIATYYQTIIRRIDQQIQKQGGW